MLESIAFSERRSFPAAEAGCTARRTKAERETRDRAFPLSGTRFKEKALRNHACDASRVRGARLLSMFGLACYIAWSFLFWNGPLLMIGPWDAAGASVAFVVQGIATVVASVLIAGIALRSPGAFLRFAAFALFCGLSIAAVVLLALSRGDESVQQLSIAFALSGAGSTLRLLWEERISLGGVRTVALTVATAYVLGYVLFVACALLASEAVIAAAIVLSIAGMLSFFAADSIPKRSKGDGGRAKPSGKEVCPDAAQRSTLGAAAHGDANASGVLGRNGRAGAFFARDIGTSPVATRPPSLKELAKQLPVTHLVIVALAFFGYGAMRTTGVIGGYATGNVLSSALSAGVPALASLVAVLLAYCLHRKNASLTFYVAFPLMVIAALIPPELDPFSGGAAFCIALVGSETIKYVVWFMLVRSFAQDQVSALFILAMLRCAQWLGSVAGQSASLVAPTGQTLSIVVLLALMMALLLAVGLPSRGFFSTPDASVQDQAKPRDHVALAVRRYGLTPREAEILGYWAGGYSSPYIEKKLFISKSTVKTHLGHIYEKTKTSNRQSLLELLESLE